MKKLLCIGLLGSLLILSACGDDKASSTDLTNVVIGVHAANAACTFSIDGSTSGCILYSGSQWTQAAVDAGCAGSLGTVLAACPQDNNNGYCTRSAGLPSEYSTRYYGYTALEEAAMCPDGTYHAD